MALLAGEHYTWGDGCDGWHLLKTDRLSVIREKMPAGTAEVFHHHERAQQVFFILAGAAVMVLDGAIVEMRAGDAVHVPAGTVHQIRNESSADVEFLVISEPPSHGDRVLDRRQPVPPGF